MSGECDCSRILTAGRFLCGVCEKGLAVTVGQAVGLVADLRVTAERLDRTGKPGPIGSGSGVAALPVRLDASRLGAVLGRVLEGFPGPTPQRRAFLAARHPDGPSWAARLEDLVVKAVAVVDLPPEWIRLGMCGAEYACEDGSVVWCEQELAVPATAQELTCEVCGSWYDVAARQDERLASAWDAVAPAPVIVRALATQGVRVEVKHIENWAQLGHLGRVCDVWSRCEGFRVGDVHAVALRMAERRARAATRRSRPVSRETANF